MSIWSPRLRGMGNGKVDLSLCRESVWPRDGAGFDRSKQCNRKAVVFRCVDGHDGELGFCKQHDPVAIAAKRKAQSDAWNAKWDAERRKAERDKQTKAAADAARAALERIAAGHNDPRSLAAEVLALYPSASDIKAPALRQDAPAA